MWYYDGCTLDEVWEKENRKRLQEIERPRPSTTSMVLDICESFDDDPVGTFNMYGDRHTGSCCTVEGDFNALSKFMKLNGLYITGYKSRFTSANGMVYRYTVGKFRKFIYGPDASVEYVRIINPYDVVDKQKD